MSSASDRFTNSIPSDDSLKPIPESTGVGSSPESLEPSILERVLNSFLQERNIRWMLGLGVLILLGSSLTFVTNQWNEMQDVWKYLVLLGYTGAIHICGQAAYHRLNLRKTGTALMMVTLLLIPLVFFSLHWVSAGTAVQAAGLVFLIFSAMAGRRIVRHFFRGDQPVVLACYLTLSVFGAAASMLPSSLGPLWVLCVWAIFAFGSVKANREVFWMTEENRLPRVFGFFPIALFGAQFVAIFALHFRDAFPTNDWLGLSCVLTAIPIMLSADSFARVFKQRTGDLVRPFPWSIIGPIVLGLALSVAGLIVAGTGIPGGRPFALVPTAAVFALMMGITAKRTRHRGFVWAMLFGITMTYQFSPVFFKGLVEEVRNAAATAVNEPKLPVWYYGLTYMPLLFVASVVARWRLRVSEIDFFGTSLKHFTLGMSVALLAVSYFHPGANFLVGLTMMGFFLWQARIYRRKEAIGFAIIACVTATVQAVPFFEHVTGQSLPQDCGIFGLSVVALLMQTAGRFVDRFFDQHATSSSDLPKWFASWQSAALPVTLGAVGWWLFSAVPGYQAEPAPWSGLLLTSLLASQAILSPKRGFGEATLAFGLILFGLHARAAAWFSSSGLVLVITAVLFAMYVFSRLTSKRTDRVAVAFSKPAHRVSHLLILAAGGIGFASVLTGMQFVSFSLPVSLAGLLATIWCFSEGQRKPTIMLLAFISCLAWQAGVVRACVDIEWLLATWALTSVVLLRYGQTKDASILEPLSIGLMSVIATVSLLFFGLPIAVAGGIVMAGFLMQARLSDNRNLRGLCLIVANWQVIGIVLRFVCQDVISVFDLTTSDILKASLPIAALSAVSSLLLQHPRVRSLRTTTSALELKDLLDLQFWALTATSTFCLAISVMHLQQGLTAPNAASAMIAFGCLAVSTLMSARDRQSELRVWASMLIVGGGVLYLALFKVIALGSGLSMFAVLAAAGTCAMLARVAAKRETFKFAAKPLAQAARLLPIGTVGIALIRRYGMQADSDWLGMNSLAVLASAAYYFWCGLEENRRSLIVLAASIVNFLFFMLCFDLECRDPQFFMIPIGVSIVGVVQLLKREIPRSMQTPLRYAGALMILVSPIFNIVNGSWLHMFSLLICAIVVALVAIGLRIRPLLYAGTAFLIADIVAMVGFGVSDHPDKLWLFGLAAGAAVIGLAAFFEKQRANVLSRVRSLATELETWQ